jgi:hypothetical protein
LVERLIIAEKNVDSMSNSLFVIITLLLTDKPWNSQAQTKELRRCFLPFLVMKHHVL